eukprot:SRR837773.9760.p4 GENE.SRR837773.9760~~SRR837773.9760.p4  ORF type:complete len:127 (+),score=18.05 SRR837773.9760:361-741(+)
MLLLLRSIAQRGCKLCTLRHIRGTSASGDDLRLFRDRTGCPRVDTCILRICAWNGRSGDDLSGYVGKKLALFPRRAILSVLCKVSFVSGSKWQIRQDLVSDGLLVILDHRVQRRRRRRGLHARTFQ